MWALWLQMEVWAHIDVEAMGLGVDLGCRWALGGVEVGDGR